MRIGVLKFQVLLFLFLSMGHKNHAQTTDTAKVVLLFPDNLNLFVNEKNRAQLDQIQLKDLLITNFKLDWSAAYGSAYPYFSRKNEYYYINLSGLNYTPRIAITNRVFQYTPVSEIPELARRTSEKINIVSEKIWSATQPRDFRYYTVEEKKKSPTDPSWRTSIKEIQIDCDWDQHTQSAYFLFVELLQKYFPGIAINCTIRPKHYVERRKLGIPPVKRATFLYENPNRTVPELRRMFKGKPYPLPLDVALPLWNWVQWSRNEQFLGAMHWNATSSFDPEYSSFGSGVNNQFSSIDSTGFRILRDTVVDGQFLLKNDRLVKSPTDTMAIKSFFTTLNQKNAVANRQVILIDWDVKKLKAYASFIQNIRQMLH